MIAACLAITLLCGDDPQGGPEALALFRETARACQAAPAYQDHGRFVIESQSADRTQSAAWPIAIQKGGPNRLAIDAGNVQLFADGQTMLTVVGPTRKYTSQPCPPAIRTAQLTEGPLGAMLLGGPYRAISRVLLALMFEDDAVARLSADVRDVQTGPDTPIDDRACKTIRIHWQGGTELRLAIDPETRLPRAIDLKADPAQFADKVPGATAAQTVRIAWLSGPVSTEPLDPSVFQTVPPQGHTQVEAVQVPPEKRQGPPEKP